MTFFDPRLQQAADFLRPTVAIPTIIQTEETHPGQTRLREFQGLGALTRYAARYLPQVHADLNQATIQSILKSRAAVALHYDEPHYAFQLPPGSQVRIPLGLGGAGDLRAAPSLRSTPEEIKARIDQRLALVGPPHETTNPGIEWRTYLGFMGPKSNSHERSAYLSLEDSRAFTKSKTIYDAGATGKGVLVSVIDTGVNGTHPMLEGQVTEHLSFTAEEPGDGNGHGTHVASTIAGKRVTYNGRITKLQGKELQGMADEAKILDCKVLTSEGAGQLSSIIAAVETSIERGAQILNMSLGSLFGGIGQGPDAQAVNEASRRGIIVCCASGNSFAHGTVGSPGSAAGAVTVGSVSMVLPGPGHVSRFSSRGPTFGGLVKPTISAPGGNLGQGQDETILAATSGVIDTETQDGGYASLRGTSMACPVVSGVLAQLLPKGLPRDRQALEGALARGVNRDFPYKDNSVGWGLIDAERLQLVMGDTRRLPLRNALARVGSRGQPLLGFAGRALAALGKRPSTGEAAFRIALV